MNKLNDAIDRFCALHRNFGIYNLMRYIVAGNILVYALHLLTGADFRFIDLLTLSPHMVIHGFQLWRLITFVFIPFDFGPLWLVLSLFFYYQIGNTLERQWGSGKFTIYYLSGVVLTVLASFLAYALGGSGLIAGLHYVNLSLYLAYAMLYPEAYINLFFLVFFIPVKIKWLAVADLLYFAFDFLYSVGQRDWGGALAPVVALLNFFIFFSPYFSRSVRTARYQNSRQAINFKKAVREQRREKGFNHKCEVCGRTDTDFPDLQFRYCSKCEGYHCFCEDHILNHQHHTE